MTTLPDASRDAMLTALVGLLDGGYVEVRDGTAPDPDDPATGTLLVTLPLNSPAFVVVSGVATADVTPQPEDNAVATGTAGWFRAYAFDDTPVIDGIAADMDLSTSAVVDGAPVKILSWTITMPDGS